VQATLQPLLQPRGPGSPILKTSLQDVAGIEIAGASEGGVVRLSLKRPSDFVLRALCDIPILPEHLLRGGKGGAAALGRQPIGTGPFRFAGWERGKRLRLERWPSYWGEGARLESIVFEIDLDGASALTRMRRGDLDVLPRILAAHYPDQVDATSLRGGAVAVWRLASRRWVYLGVNHRHAPLGDAGLRQALAALWDRERLSQTLHGGMARPLVGPPIVEMAPPPSGRALAAARLEAAGYRDSNSDGVREFEGKPVRVSLLVASGGHAAATEARAFVLEARKVGVLVDTVPVDAATLMTRVRKGDFDLAFMSWQGSPNEDPGLQFATTGPFNFWGYRSAPLDGLLDDLRRTSDTGAREGLLGEVATLLARDQPVLFLYRLDVPVLISRRVHGIAAVADRWDLRHAWVDR
jgi:peptide/nickel transport system substrate-binding protein